MDQLKADETMTVIIRLRQQADIQQTNNLNRAEQLSKVIDALKVTADDTQSAVTLFLRARNKGGAVKSFTSFWIFNGFSVTANAATIMDLAALPDVHSISLDAIDIVPADSGPLTLSNPEPNISLVSAPAVWNLGYTGQGVVVAALDSGADSNHPDLLGRWRGGTNSWFDPFGQHPNFPIDLSGHGTLTMGVMLGGDAGGTSVGVAPGAQWIAARIFNDQGSSTATAIHQSYQWLLDPDNNQSTADAPQVVNNSWTFAVPGCNLEFEPDLQILRAAGILPVFAAGNGGPNANTSYSPANNPSAFAVGTINNSSIIYGLSSRGPSTCGDSTEVFPDMVAPGVNVNSTDLGGFYSTSSGTSISAPHVSGGLALLLSAFPNLSALQQETALRSSAVDLGATGPDDIYGYGRLDLLSAYNAVDITGPAAAGLSLSPNPSNGSTNINLNASISDVSSGGNNIIAAEYFVDAAGANGAGFAITASDAGYDSSTESVSGSIDPTGLTSGNHDIYVHGQDSAGNWGPFSIITLVMDLTAPTVVSSVRAGAVNPTDAANIDFTVTFSEPVTGVDASDFLLTTTSASNVTVSGLSGTGSIYTVTVDTGSGNGTIRLDVVDDNSIMDAAASSLGGAVVGDGNFAGGEIYTIIKSATFSDVPLSYWASAFIERLYIAGITGGCSTSPLMYCPETPVTRAQMAVFLLKGIHGSSYTPPPVDAGTGFNDVSAGHWAAAWIKQLAVEGITGGCGNGNYCPEATVTRAQVAVFLLRARYSSAYNPPSATGVFTDVPVGYWSAAWIEQLAAEGITGGCGPGTYCPESPVTRAQMAIFLVRTFNLP
ncbi:MAG: S8 family serine peptidase [Chloroflexi bacterium]|nr:S8 family serine peptidase [Chloroflexota bacterium]